MMKGIELYKGKAIFHGLGLFIPATKAVPADQTKERQSFLILIFLTFFPFNNTRPNTRTGN